MKIAFIHYHLKTGGVTTVLKQQTESLRGDVLVMAGEIPGSFPFDTVEIPGLGYDSAGVSYHPEDVAESVLEAIYAKWEQGCDVLHVHNATLAKSKKFLKILKILQDKGIRLFIQLHDFAEDGRPSAYFPDAYPRDCHYGVINSRDYHILAKAGLKAQGLHYLPNIVNFFDFRHKDAKTENIVIYPVRAIRRKNIGEAMLLSLFFQDHATLGITQPPNSLSDMKSYEDWKDYACKKDLNVVFDAGVSADFESLVLSSKFVITTSITEGFGFSFLEPWTGGKMLWGRKLPDICRDFEKNGVRLDHLYTRLNIPIEWLNTKEFREKRRSCILSACDKFNHPIDPAHIDHSFETIIRHGCIDFGLLDESFQKQVISRVLFDKKNAERLKGLNPFLSSPAEVPDPAALTEQNRKAITSHYNQIEYRKKLLDVYSDVITSPVCQRIDKTCLLNHFFDLEQFSLLKWGDYAG